MTLRLHNTLSGKVEDFSPIDAGKVGMYHCGPTVYDYAHIGNLRSYVFADILRRTLEYLGFETKQVVNITDIGHLTSDADTGDDKMVKGLKREGLPLSLDGLKQLADKYEQAFKDDLKTLNIETPHHFPRATEYLNQEIELIKKIEENGYAYNADDGIYFDISKFGEEYKYGELGGLTPTAELEIRIGLKQKHNPRDFVLWKISSDDKLGFESPWGRGFPGWHIECSAMSRELLGQPFDIHTGGMDHIPVHHNNEIAQSEAAYGTKLANLWLHNEFLKVNEAKIAKSEGTGITLRELIQAGFNPLAYRYFLLMAHYRSPINFTWEALEAAQNAYKKLKDLGFRIKDLGIINEEYRKQFKNALEDDLNTPEALAVVWNLIKDESISPADKRAMLLEFDKVLGLNLSKNEFLDVPAEIVGLGEKRQKAKDNKDFAEADRIRSEIESKGYEIRDTEGTFLIMKK